MIEILRNGKRVGEIDENKRAIITKSYPLRILFNDQLANGVIVGKRGWFDKKRNVYIDTAETLLPKDGEKFWNALEEELVLEGYDIA